MCVAFPGKIIAIDGDCAKADFAGTRAEVNISMVDARVGDYVLVHAGMALQTLCQTEAEALSDLFAEAAEAARA